MAHRGAAGARVGAAHGAGALLPAAAPRPARAHARALRGLAAARPLRAQLRKHTRRVPGRRYNTLHTPHALHNSILICTKVRVI